MKIYEWMLNELTIPVHVLEHLQKGRYMEYVTKPRPFVVERHEIGDSQHFDLRLWVGEPYGMYAVGWSIVGFSKDDPAEIEKWIENIGKGFRAETKCVNEFCNEWKFIIYEKDGKYYYKTRSQDELSIEELARQPYAWFFPKLKIGESLEIEPGEVGAGEEAPGRFTILTRGKWLSGAQKAYFHEYFLKDGRYFKDWTRVVVRGIKVAKIDPETKKPIPGKYERMWRFMIPKTQIPYAISSRAIKENWKPPKEAPFPFPREWVKKSFPDQYRRWLQWITKSEEEDISKLEKLYIKKKSELLSKNIRFTLSLASWMGYRAKTGRQMPQFRWYLLLDDTGKGSVRRFFLDGYPLRDEIMGAYEMDRVSRKWLDYEGATEPDTPFNPNKELVGKYTIIDKGTVSYESKRVDGEEVISLTFKGKKLKGKWELRQEEKGADVYVLEKLSEKQLSLLTAARFVLDIHEFPERTGKKHLDLRFHVPGETFLRELNLFTTDEIWKYPEEKPVKARLKTCEDLEWMKIKKPDTRMKAYGRWSRVETLDHGTLEIIDENPNFISMNIKGEKLKGYYIARKTNKLWDFMKSKLPHPLCDPNYIWYYKLSKEGDPRIGTPYKEFIIEQKKGWDHFIVHLYDLRKFTRVEPDEKVKDYLPDLSIPEGVRIGIGLYPVPGRIHHARVAYVDFDADKWTYERAINWIKKHKLHYWIRTQIRKS
jgi:hypothetical protein